MKKRSFNYWKKRELANQLNQIKDEKVTIANMEENFNIALEDIEQQINIFYERYAKSQGISIEEALKRVSEHDVKAFEKKAKEYVKKKDFSPEANAQLKLYNATMRINRLELLKAELNLHLTDMTTKNSDLIEKHLEKLADSEYARQSGILDTKLRFSKEGVKAIVNSDYKYGNFSKNIWTNQEALMGNIATMLRRSIIQGANPTDMIGRLRSQFNVSKHEAKRLLVTEASRVQGDVQLDAIEQAGYDEYLYISEPTACEICKQLDGKHFKIKDREVGVNFYPMHPYCKCSSAAYYDSEQLDKEIAEYRKERGLDKAEESGILEEKSLKEKINNLDIKKADYKDIIDIGKDIDKLYKVSEFIGDKEKLKEVFSKFRTIGGKVPNENWAKGSNKVIKEHLEEAFSNYPVDWAKIPENNNRQILVRKNKRGFFTKGAVTPSGKYFDTKYDNFREGYYTITSDGIRRDTAYHEIGHLVQSANPEVIRIEKEWVASRTKDEKFVKLKDIFPFSGYGNGEVVKKDNFVSPYIGKYYDDFTEVLTVGLEGIFNKEKRYTKSFDKTKWEYETKKITDDKEFLHLVIGLILKG